MTADDADQYLRATASYEDERGSNKTATAGLTTQVGDTQPTANTAPEFTQTEPVNLTIAAGPAAGRRIGSPVRATDADIGDVLSYSLIGTDADTFDIDAATGQILTKVVLEHDPDGDNEYTVSVGVSDGFDSGYSPSSLTDDTIQVIITVTQAQRRQPSPPPAPDPQTTPDPEPTVSTGGGGGGGGAFIGSISGIGTAGSPPTVPSFAAGARTTLAAPADAQPGDAVGSPVVATRPGATAISYSLSGSGAAHFTVEEGTGQIRVAPDAELRPGQSYTVTLTATDNLGRTGSIMVTFRVPGRSAGYYDLNGDGEIQKGEVLGVVSDYIAGFTGKEVVLGFISLYFAG